MNFPARESYTVQPGDTIENIIQRIEQSIGKSIGTGYPHANFIPCTDVLVTQSSIKKVNGLIARIKCSIKRLSKVL